VKQFRRSYLSLIHCSVIRFLSSCRLLRLLTGKSGYVSCYSSLVFVPCLTLNSPSLCLIRVFSFFSVCSVWSFRSFCVFRFLSFLLCHLFFVALFSHFALSFIRLPPSLYSYLCSFLSLLVSLFHSFVFTLIIRLLSFFTRMTWCIWRQWGMVAVSRCGDGLLLVRCDLFCGSVCAVCLIWSGSVRWVVGWCNGSVSRAVA
jgi:hypothetical protein